MKPSVFFLICIAFVIPSFASRADEAKSWVHEVNAGAPGPFRAIRPVAVSYTLTWGKVLNAGKMDIHLTQPDPGVYLWRATGRSAGVARAVFPYDFTGAAQTSAESLKPLRFQLNDQQKHRSHRYSIDFEPRQIVSHTHLTDRESGKTTPFKHVFEFDRDVGMDLASAILYLRSQPLKRGDRIRLVVATFNRPYLIDFRVLGQEKKRVRGKRYDAIKLALRIEKIHADMTKSPYERIESATVWISDDEFRLPLEFEGDIFIGYVCARMTDRRWL